MSKIVIESEGKDNYHMKMTPGKRQALSWGITLIVAAILIAAGIVLKNFGYLEGFPVWEIVVGILLIALSVKVVTRGTFYLLPWPLGFLFVIFESHIAEWAGISNPRFINHWIVLGLIILLSAGLKLIKSASAKGKKKGKGASTVYIDCAEFAYEEIDNDIGVCNVFFSNIDSYSGAGTLHIENDVGVVNVHVPSSWRIHCHMDNDLGNINVPQGGSPDGKLLKIEGDNDIGTVNVIFEV